MPRTRDESRTAEAVRLYHSARLTEAEVAGVMEVSERTVRRWLEGTARSTGPRTRADVNDTLILDLKDREGLSFEAIGRRVGLSKTGVRMRYYALTGRSRAGRAPRDESGEVPAGSGETTGGESP